jgi:predicted Zn-dependent peptidase
MAAVFPTGHPYHHTPIGSMEDLDAATLEDVEAFFRSWYVPNNAVLTVAGDVDEQPVIDAVERYFGPIPPNEPLPRFRIPDAESADPSREVVPDDVPLERVHVGYRCPAFGSREFDALEVAMQILAGGRGSRLHKRLVRQERVAQDVAFFALPLVASLRWSPAPPAAPWPRIRR